MLPSARAALVIRVQRLKEARKQGTHTKEEWQALCKEFDYRCVCCWEQPLELTKDHIVPICEDGSDSIDNIQPFCRTCNSSKNGFDFYYDNFNWVKFRRRQKKFPFLKSPRDKLKARVIKLFLNPKYSAREKAEKLGISKGSWYILLHTFKAYENYGKQQQELNRKYWLDKGYEL